MTETCKVVFLNGTSSSGKTSIAKHLQELLLPDIYLNFSIDSILYALPPSALKRMTTGQDISDLRYDTLVEAYYSCARTLVVSGHHLIMDDAVTGVQSAAMVKRHLEDLHPVMVGVHCDLQVLKARELNRGDRTIGEAEWQFPTIHSHIKYDIEVDTTTTSAIQVAENIATILKG